MIGYRLLPPAEEEMTGAALFYEAARAGFGDVFLDHIQRVIDALRRRPELGFDVGDGFRRALVRRFPFNIIYPIDADEIVVVSARCSWRNLSVLKAQRPVKAGKRRYVEDANRPAEIAAAEQCVAESCK